MTTSIVVLIVVAVGLAWAGQFFAFRTHRDQIERTHMAARDELRHRATVAETRYAEIRADLTEALRRNQQDRELWRQREDELLRTILAMRREGSTAPPEFFDEAWGRSSTEEGDRFVMAEAERQAQEALSDRETRLQSVIERAMG